MSRKHLEDVNRQLAEAREEKEKEKWQMQQDYESKLSRVRGELEVCMQDLEQHENDARRCISAGIC